MLHSSLLHCQNLTLVHAKLHTYVWENMCPVFVKEFSSLSFFPLSVRLSMTKRWLIIMLRLFSWYPYSIFRSIEDNGISIMTKSSWERVPLWKIPLLMLTSHNTWLFAVRIVFHLSMSLRRSFFALSANHASSIASFRHEFGIIL